MERRASAYLQRAHVLVDHLTRLRAAVALRTVQQLHAHAVEAELAAEGEVWCCFLLWILWNHGGVQRHGQARCGGF